MADHCLICKTQLSSGQLTCPLGTLLCRPAPGTTITCSWDGPRRGNRPHDYALPTLARPASGAQALFECQPIGNLCSICHCPFSEGDDMCTHGHFIGQYYPRPGA